MPELLNTILGTFLGALLGIPAGFALNHCWTKFVDQARRAQLLSVLKRAVEHNDYLVGQSEEWLGKGGYPYFNVDLPLLESTASLKYERLDPGLCREIDHLRYELGHLARKVDLLLSLEFNPSAKFAISSPVGSIYNELRPKLVESIRAHLQPIRETLEGLNGKLRCSHGRHDFPGMLDGGAEQGVAADFRRSSWFGVRRPLCGGAAELGCSAAEGCRL